MKMNLNFEAHVPINFAPKTGVLFIHKHSHSSFQLKHFVTAAFPMPLYMQINAIVERERWTDSHA